MKCADKIHYNMKEIRPRAKEEKGIFSTHARYIEEGEQVWRYYVRVNKPNADLHKRVCNVCGYTEYQYVKQMKTNNWFTYEILGALSDIQQTLHETGLHKKQIEHDDVSVTYKFYIPRDLRIEQLNRRLDIKKEVNHA